MARQLGALVVDFLDVGFGAGRAHDVLGCGDPARKPVEALLAHALREDRHAAAAEDVGDGDAAAAVVAGRGPHRALARRIETARDEARGEAGIGGQHLVRADHREECAERHDDPGLHAGEGFGQLDEQRRCRLAGAIQVVEPVDAKEVAGMGDVGIDLGEALQDCARDAGRLGKLGKRRQPHAPVTQMGDGAGTHRGIVRSGREVERAGHAPILCSCCCAGPVFLLYYT